MQFNLKIYILIIFTLFFTACSQKTIQQKKQPKPHVQTQTYNHKESKYCNKGEKIMLYASKYIIDEFDKGYFQKKDIVGAKAQLFLIEKKSPTIFAQNINAARDSYKKQYELAKKYGCDVKKFKVFPIDKIKNTIISLEEIKK